MKGKTDNEGEETKGVVSLEELKEKMADFAKEREWDQFHTPRNLLLAMVSVYPFFIYFLTPLL